MKKGKRLLTMIMAVLVLMIALIPSFVYAYYYPEHYPCPKPLPSNASTEYVAFIDESGTLYETLYLIQTDTDEHTVVEGTDILFETCNAGTFYWDRSTDEWIASVAYGYQASLQVGLGDEVIEASFSIEGFYIGALGEISSPDDEQIYTRATLPDVVIEYSGFDDALLTLEMETDAGPTWSLVTSWEYDTADEYTLDISGIPVAEGYFRLKLYNTENTPNDLMDEVEYTINNESICLIIMPVDGNTYSYKPTLFITKTIGYEAVKIYVNDDLFTNMKASEGTNSYKNMPYKLGENVIEIRASDDGTVIQTVTINLLRLDDQDNDIGIDDLSDMPDPPTEPGSDSNFFDWVSYYFQMLMYYIKYPFVVLGNLINDLVESIDGSLDSVTNLTGSFSQFFSWLPTEIIALMGVAMTVIIILRILKR